MGNVLNLCLSEPSAIDTDAVQMLKRELGEKRCRSVVDTIIFEITDTLCRVERLIAAESFVELPDHLMKLRDQSAQVGLICMLDVANDLIDAVEQGDHTAASAIASRLIRLGEDSLFSLIEFADRSII